MRLLVVANETIIGPHIAEYVQDLNSQGEEVDVYLLVPATPLASSPGSPSPTLLDASGARRAGRQLASAIKLLEKSNVPVAGEVGVRDPMAAVDLVMMRREFDRILVSTVSAGTSRWFKMDLQHRLQRRYGIPVDHVFSDCIDSWEPTVAPDGTRRMLIIDDSPADVDLVTEALNSSTEFDLEMKIVMNGAAALDYIREIGPDGVDLILLDLKMPLLDGHGFMEGVSEEFDIDQLNIVVVTTSDAPNDRERAHALGAGAYLLKDPDFDVFSEGLLSLVNEYAGLDKLPNAENELVPH